LRKTGYFDPEMVARDYALIASGQANKVGVFKRLGLSGIVATQLWHHLYISGGLCDLPEHSPRPQVDRPSMPPAAA
jgi:asparagine synthase (glutamine-hydrolysing)